MPIDQDDVIKIIKLMDESGYDSLHLEMGDLKLTIAKGGSGPPSIEVPVALAPSEAKVPAPSPPAPARQAAPKAASAPAASQPKTPVQVSEDGLVPIKSPLLGTFYCSPKPGAPPFVEVGAKIAKDDTVCLIEVMKTFTTLKAGMNGRIAKVCAENAQMVEYHEVLFLVEPE